MDLSKIMAISGKPGLFKMLTETKNGLVVESMLDGKRHTVFSHEKISSLEEISIYTENEDLPLKEVLKAMYDKLEGEPALSHKSESSELKAFFEEAVPDYDKENVYVSDIKKVINWYNVLLAEDLLDFTEEEKEEKSEDNEEETKETTSEEIQEETDITEEEENSKDE